ncbi:GNAT family N-acetyltransferase [Devosia sp. SL43]|uniref:GNAT family N-acetyltransferase n=1 Tax=Devosia sp. SL43 TaxID=2806348 RepID=UPI001F03281E|nr:GNAT family N-acetyltransferase [Devosia sp. SL43]UJW85611.1 GNAT family N-acetyltransferase [Devosia sp. SL43]
MTPSTITIVPATADQKPLIANLIQLYLYDMTESMPFPVGADGCFEYDFLDRFWQFPYLIYSNDEIAGFALVIDECPLTERRSCWFMAEFFVLKAYRRSGVGQAALSAITANHPGDWHIGVPEDNRPAQAFWGRALAPYTPESRHISFDGADWRLNAFAV